jgi:adenine-specific DNA-methyltransferase
MTNYDKLINILEEVFMLDKAELDFGIYRIMNQKRHEIDKFLKQDLIPQVKQVLASSLSVDKEAIKKDLDEAVKQAQALGIDPDASPKVQQLKARLGEAGDIEGLENQVFSYLTTFFKRYFDNGDFISQRRYKENTYAIPYEGEEVKLHWANHDQYYIKTSEYLKNYRFKLGNGKAVAFELVEASTEQNNNKAQGNKERRFALYTDKPLALEDGELKIYFTYEPMDKGTKQDALLAKAFDVLKTEIAKSEYHDYLDVLIPGSAKTEKNKNRTLLEKHLTDYTARNSFDYFIHKDLYGFLCRELDFFIKNEILYIDDINTRDEQDFLKQLSKIKAFKTIGEKIITFLAQLENFQKKLWLKKKFVVETNYCITLDRVPEEFYADIAANEAQIDEWVKLFAIDEIKGSAAKDMFSKAVAGFTKPLTVDFLKQNHFLVLDTVFFSEEFKLRLIGSIENFDDQCDGLMFNSENFQALRFLGPRFSNKINYIYIDPPYNTDSAPILYKNDYKHSSWISLIYDRIMIAKSLLHNEGLKTVAIDDAEMVNLSMLLENVYTNYRITKVPVVHNPKGSITKDFNRVHEYAIFLTPEELKNCVARTLEENETPRKMRRWGENSLRTERKLSFYPIYVKGGKISRIGSVPPDDFHPISKNVKLDTGEIEIWPIDQDGVERRWNFGLDSIEDNLSRIKIQEVDGLLDLFLTHELTVPKTVWAGGEYDAGNYGNTLLVNILGKKIFDFPKSINLVSRCVRLATTDKDKPYILDFFAGSGTTAHAAISLNRGDKVGRKYILVEMGAYFDPVTKERTQKVIYSKDWKDGKPVGRDGISHCFKYIYLESYEDALNNLSLKRSEDQAKILDANGKFREGYMLNYMLDVESSDNLLNLEWFRNPFECYLNITRNNELQPTKVDFVETFNYLIGLTVDHTYASKGYRVVTGQSPAGERVLVVWRNLDTHTNQDLNDFLSKSKYNPLDGEFDRIYVNGDNNVENMKVGEERWKVVLIEEEFKKRMFEA